MQRPQAIAVVLIIAAAAGLWAFWRPATTPTALGCPDGGVWQEGADGVASCQPGRELRAGRALTLRQKFDCNTASEGDLALVPGIGRHVARELVSARDGGFTSWEQIDGVPGMGEARVLALQAACEIRLGDGGVW